jgi:plasmid stabilization system protein ParE
MVKVIWTKKAFGQLERAIKYIREEQGLTYAETVLNKMLQTTELLEH